MPLFRRGDAERQPTDIAKSMEFFVSRGIHVLPAEAITEAFPDVWAAWANLASVCLDRDESGDLDRAIDALRTAYDLAIGTSAGPEQALLFVGQLMSRHSREAGIADLEEGDEVLDRAVRAVGDGKERSQLLAMRCYVAYALAKRMHSDGVMAGATEFGEAAVHCARSAEDRIQAWGKLGLACLGHYEMTGRAQSLDRALELFGRALRTRLGRKDGLGLSMVHANALHLRYRRDGRPGDLEQALALCRSALSEIGDEDDRATALLRLGSCLHDRYSLVGHADDLRDGVAALHEALAVGAAEHNMTVLVEAGRMLGDWSAHCGDWLVAADSYQVVLEVLQRSLAAQTMPAHQRLTLGVDVRMPAKAAHALAMAGRPDDALLALERWRAVLTEDSAQLTPAQIMRLSRKAPLVYLASCESAGLALLVRHGHVEHVPLPHLDSDRLQSWTERFLQAKEERGRERQTWENVLDWLGTWLWDAVMGPVLARAEAAEHLVLVPCGLLGLLPLHAAWTADERAPTGRRYALDVALLTYAPSARALRRARHHAQRPSGDTCVSVENPANTVYSPLPCAEIEGEVASSLWKKSVRMPGGHATKDRVVAALPGAHALHFACHTGSDPRTSEGLGLQLAGGEILSAGDVTALRLDARIAVLSACETAVLDTEALDEVIGLPSTFLEAGAAGVIASLWPVVDESTMLLMVRFYELWRRSGISPAQALRSAQQWLRDSTNGDKRAFFEEQVRGTGWMPERVAMACWQQMVLQDPYERSLASPGHWAAFMLTGA
ncbi:CHAT domain-containing protein [Streptomyces sp. NPDC059627]